MPNDDNRRSRNRRDRRDPNPDQNRKIILAKKEELTQSDASQKQLQTQPKLLLKPKEEQKSTEKSAESQNVLKDKPKEVVAYEEPVLMTKPLSLLTLELVLNIETFFSYIQEASTQFHVVAFVGTQNTGKSFLANLLLNKENSLENLKNNEKDVFVTRGPKHILRIDPITEGTFF